MHSLKYALRFGKCICLCNPNPPQNTELCRPLLQEVLSYPFPLTKLTLFSDAATVWILSYSRLDWSVLEFHINWLIQSVLFKRKAFCTESNVHFFSWLHSIPLCGHTSFCVYIDHMIDV